MSISVKISAKKVQLWQRKSARNMLKMIAQDIQMQTERGISATGGRFKPYKSKELRGIPVDLTQTGNMLAKMRISARKKAGTVKPRAFYARFQQAGTRRKDGSEAIPARPFVVLRPHTLKRLEKWTQDRLREAFEAPSLQALTGLR